MQRAFCILAYLPYLAAQTDAVGPAREFGCRHAVGHFQRRIDDFTLFKVEFERIYDVRVPGHDRLENDRVVTEVPFVPPHGSIEEELAASVAAAMCHEQELPPNIFPASSGTLECTWHHVAAGHQRGRDSVLKAGQYLGDLRCEHRNRFAAPSRNAPEDWQLQVRVQRMVLNFLCRGVRQVELFGNDVLVGTVCSAISFLTRFGTYVRIGSLPRASFLSLHRNILYRAQF